MKRIEQKFFAALLACALAMSESAWGFSDKDHEELLKDGPYRGNWEDYQALMGRAKELMTSEDIYLLQEREKNWFYSDSLDEEAKEMISEETSRAEAYTAALAMHIDEVSFLVDQGAIVRQGRADGTSGLYRMESGALKGELTVSKVEDEDGEYSAVLILKTEDDEPAGHFEGSGKLKGRSLEATGVLMVEEFDAETDTAAIALTFDDRGAAVATTEEFKRNSREKKWLDGGVVFDGTYARQRSVFEDEYKEMVDELFNGQ